MTFPASRSCALCLSCVLSFLADAIPAVTVVCQLRVLSSVGLVDRGLLPPSASRGCVCGASLLRLGFASVRRVGHEKFYVYTSKPHFPAQFESACQLLLVIPEKPVRVSSPRYLLHF